jgi:hypothetical protein
MKQARADWKLAAADKQWTDGGTYGQRGAAAA